MQTPALAPLFADRNVAFDADVLFIGFDFTGGAARSMVRLAPDATGAAILTPTTTISYAGTDTVANHITAGRITAEQVPTGYAPTDNMTLSIINLAVTKANMALAAIPAPEEGDMVELAYDLLIDPADGAEDKYAYGPFNVRGTVTYP